MAEMLVLRENSPTNSRRMPLRQPAPCRGGGGGRGGGGRGWQGCMPQHTRAYLQRMQAEGRRASGRVSASAAPSWHSALALGSSAPSSYCQWEEGCFKTLLVVRTPPTPALPPPLPHPADLPSKATVELTETSTLLSTCSSTSSLQCWITCPMPAEGRGSQRVARELPPCCMPLPQCTHLLRRLPSSQ